MKNCGFYCKTLTPIARDCRAFAKKHILIAILSLIWGVLGIVLGIMECGKMGAETFVIIYGKRFYLIATRNAGVGGVFSAEILVGIFIIGTIILTTASRYLLWIADIFFSIACFLKTVSIGYLLTEVGIISKILAVAVLSPCLLLFILWFCCFHAASCEFCPLGWRLGGFKRMITCHYTHLLLFVSVFLAIVFLEFFLFLLFCVLL